MVLIHFRASADIALRLLAAGEASYLRFFSDVLGSGLFIRSLIERAGQASKRACVRVGLRERPKAAISYIHLQFGQGALRGGRQLVSTPGAVGRTAWY